MHAEVIVAHRSTPRPASSRRRAPARRTTRSNTCSCSRCGWSRRRGSRCTRRTACTRWRLRLARCISMRERSRLKKAWCSKRGEIELGAELAVDARQQIEIELRGDALRVVVGLLQDLRVLHQIDADDEGRAAAEDAAGVAQERRRLVRLEIADGRAREESGARQLRDRGRQIERLAEIGGDRKHGDRRDIPAAGCPPAARRNSAEMSTGT